MRWMVTALCLVSAASCVGQKNETATEQPFYLTVPTPPAPVLTPAQALAGFTIAPGFTVELIAAEPLVEDPIAITWDTAGNLYVVEMRGFMPDEFGAGEDEPVGMVVRLRDSDDDGAFDLREVILDKLVLPRAIAIVNDGLLVAEPPNLWLCPGSAGDWQSIDCSRKRLLGSYGDQPGSVEHVENGLLPALDNWIYSAKSDTRLKISDGELVKEATLFRGQWGIAQDNAGRLFYNTNSNLLLGDSYDAQPVIATGLRTAPGLSARISQNDEVFAVRVNPGVNRAYVPGVLREDGRLKRPTSASGMTVYRGDQFGPDYGDNVFVTEPAANAVAQLQMKQEGLTLRTDHVLYPHEQWQQVEFFASTDERFRPVNVHTGPDGALYVVDMYRGIIQDHIFLTDELRAQALKRGLQKPIGMGRIWRIRATDAPLRAFSGTPDDTDTLIAWLGHTNGWHRDTAQRLLITRQATDVDQKLMDTLLGTSPLQVVHALWTLSGRDALTNDAISTGLSHSSPQVRLTALRAGHKLMQTPALLRLAQMEADAVVRHHAIMYLAGRPQKSEADEANEQSNVQQFLLSLLPHAAEHPYLQIALQAALRDRELDFIRRAIQTNAWSAAQGSTTGLLTHLASQAVRVAPERAGGILDLADESLANSESNQHWVASALLEGVFAVTRDPGFTRYELAAAHPIFASTNEALWSSLSKARRAYTWPGDDLAADAKPLSPTQSEHRQQGAAYFAARCATCHGDDGRGIATLAPPLVDSEWVTGPTERLVRIILHGLQGPIQVSGQAWDGVMPGHAAMPDFTDEVAAGLLTHLHRSWGHNGRGIDPDFVTQTRTIENGRTSLWTAEELENIDINTHYAELAGRYGGPGMQLDLLYDGRDLVVQSAIFNGPLREEKEDHFLFEPRNLQLEIIWSADDSVQAVRMVSESGGIELPRIAE